MKLLAILLVLTILSACTTQEKKRKPQDNRNVTDFLRER